MDYYYSMEPRESWGSTNKHATPLALGNGTQTRQHEAQREIIRAQLPLVISQPPLTLGAKMMDTLVLWMLHRDIQWMGAVHCHSESGWRYSVQRI